MAGWRDILNILFRGYTGKQADDEEVEQQTYCAVATDVFVPGAVTMDALAPGATALDTFAPGAVATGDAC